MPLAAALKEWEARNPGHPVAKEKEIRLYGGLMFGGTGKPEDGNKDKTRKLINKIVRARRARAAPCARARAPAPLHPRATRRSSHPPTPLAAQDASTATLKACERLALSTNLIDRMSSLAGMENLKILSLSRNVLKKSEKLDEVGGTLEELWLSYNSISSLDGLAPCTALRVLYIGNNKISDWAEVDKLAALPNLKDVLLQGNPIYDAAPDPATARCMFIKRCPNVDKLDNILILASERERAKTL